MDKYKLKGRIVEVFTTQARFAEALSISEQSLSAKLCGRSELTRSEIARWAQLLRIALKDIPTYFFAQ